MFRLVVRGKVCLLMFALVMLGLTTVINDEIPRINAQGGAAPVFVAPSPLNGQIFHVAEGAPISFALVADDPDGDPMTISSESNLPNGTTLTPQLSFPGSQFAWNNAGPAGSFGVSFRVTDDQDMYSEISVLISVESETPPHELTLDKAHYMVNSDVKVEVTDAGANTNFLTSDMIPVSIISDSDSVGIVLNLTESIEYDGSFFGSFMLTSGASTNQPPSLAANAGDKITVSYEGGGGLFTDTSSVNVTSTDIMLDRLLYSVGDQATITVIDSDANMDDTNVDELTVNFNSTSDTSGIVVTLEETGDNTGIFTQIAGFSTNNSGSNLLMVQVGDDIHASYGSITTGGKVTRPVSIEFVVGESDPPVITIQPTYTIFSQVGIKVIDPSKNLDGFAKEEITATVISDSDDSSFDFVLRESLVSSGEFYNAAYVYLTNETTDGAANQLHVFVDENTNDTISADYGTVTAEAIVTIHPSGKGAGYGSNGANPTEGIPIGTIQSVNCDSGHGGDTDHDGICNNWENGSSLKFYYPPSGGTLYTDARGCDGGCPTSSKKDIYVEIDYVPTYKPYYDGTKYVALNNVATEFGTTNYRFHFIVDQLLPSSHNSIKMWSDPGGLGFDQIKTAKFGTSAEATTYGSLPSSAYHDGKRQVYHYAIYGKHQTGDTGSSGIAEIIGNDIMVSLGDFAPAGLGSGTINHEEGTFMHELGHNLGLDHGGGFVNHPATGFPTWLPSHEINCKPNYASVMSYIRQFSTGLVDLGDTTKLSKFEMTLDPITTNNLNEPDGLASGGGTPQVAWGVWLGNPPVLTIMKRTLDNTRPNPINWDGLGGPTSTSADGDISNLGFPGCGTVPIPTTFDSHNDLQYLILDFRKHNAATFQNGVHTPRANVTEIDFATVELIDSMPRGFMLLGQIDGKNYDILGISNTIDYVSNSSTFVIVPSERLEKIMLTGSGKVELLVDERLFDIPPDLGRTIVLVDGVRVPWVVGSINQTTYYSVSFEINQSGKHEVTIEDPPHVIPEFSTIFLPLALAVATLVGITVLIRKKEIWNSFLV